MRVTFHQRRRTPAFRFVTRGDEKPQPGVPTGGAPAEDELSDGESSDDEFSDKEIDDGESSDEELDDEPENEGGVGTPPPKDNTPPSTPVLPGTATSSVSTVPAPTQTVTTSPTDLPPASSTPVSSQSIPAMTTNTLSPSSSSLPSSAIPVVSPSATSVLNPDDLTTPTATASPQSTSNPPLDVPQSSNAINPPDESTSSASNSSKKAGQIAGGTIGGIAIVGLILLAIWLWRRRRNRDNRLSRMPPDDAQYMNPPLGGPEKSRSPSSIMNQLMTAAYAAEEGRDYRDSNQIFDNYANEKQRFTAHENESMERLTVPQAAQLRHQSIAARTESTEKTESTWKTWGVLAGSSRVSQPRNWWVDRYFRT
ncbi:hypothetical protein EV127DRAFT_511963 [Xylaria flabelliformis]|nr:hypothetical protein EV127DRAFT_511963 [Xylaria flabelliformis]